MGKLLLGIAASIAAIGIAAPAAAGTPEEPFVGFPGAKGTVGTFAGGGGIHIGIGQPSFGDHRRDRRGGGGDGGGIWVNGGQWAQYNNQSFKSDSYNDWWHDQPWRSQPAWVRNNQSCRQYWSGGGWRC